MPAATDTAAMPLLAAASALSSSTLRWRMLAAALLGTLVMLGFAPLHLWPLSMLSLAGGFLLISRADSARQAGWLGWAYGVGYFAAATHWLYISLHKYGGMPGPLAALSVLALSLFLALYPALAAWSARRLCGQHRSLLLCLALPATWALSEWLRSWVFTGFPWASIGYSQIPGAPLAGFAAVIGIYGVGYLLALSCALLVWLPQQREALLTRRPGAWLALGSLLLLWLGGLGLQGLAWTQASGAPLKVALLQGAISQDVKWDQKALNDTLAAYYHQIQEAEGDLIVLPETAFPLFLSDLPPAYVDALLSLAQQKHAGLIVGAPILEPETQRYYNAAVLLSDPKRPSYAKSHLVPFGEFIPMKPLVGWIYETVLQIPLSDFSRGASAQPPLQVKGQAIAVNICYEDIFGEELLPGAEQAGILLNMSNLAWFDGSVALAQHGQIAQARALETGRSVLRATNTGTTAVIDPHGSYLAKLPEGIPAILSYNVQGYTGRTPYMRWGNGLFLLVCGLALVLAILARRRFPED